MISPVRAKKSLGQNFLKDPYYLRKIADAAQIAPEDQVLEIGPGLGHLTRELADRSQKLIALELDDRLIPHLQADFSEKRNVQIIHADALAYDYASLPGKWKVVANLPYYISTPIIQKLLACRDRFTSLTLMLQKEVAERIAAPPGGKEYGFLSVLVQFQTVPRIEFMVPAGAFVPRPEVDSAVISLAVRESSAVAVRDQTFFVRVIKAAFSQRRKTLRNSLKQLKISSPALDSLAAKTGLDLGRRAETLSVEEFGKLSDALQE